MQPMFVPVSLCTSCDPSLFGLQAQVEIPLASSGMMLSDFSKLLCSDKKLLDWREFNMS